ncbi:MAG: nucleotidyltransferase domain-containing protein [Oscillospiraceae bacterium]|jgi:predicted nucleotidyltransferase|nr:nucleotidyltransferase domain-containing protein [Oscillospiraceae bacterium]
MFLIFVLIFGLPVDILSGVGIYAEKVITMRYTIDEIQKKAAPIAARYGVDSLYLFGSCAYGGAESGSDIDFRVNSGRVRDLFELGGLYSDLENALGTKIDLVMTEGLNEDFLQEISRDEVLIYAGP